MHWRKAFELWTFIIMQYHANIYYKYMKHIVLWVLNLSSEPFTFFVETCEVHKNQRGFNPLLTNQALD